MLIISKFSLYMNELKINKEDKINILTGASGFLGQLILKHSNISFLTFGRSNKCDIVGNLLNNIPKLYNVNLIVHCAGIAHYKPKNKKQEALIYDTNFKGTKNLLSAFSIRNLPKKFVYISSVSVYGLEEGENIDETFPLLAKDAYGKSKIEAEKLVLKWCEKNNIICTILRLPLVVGENPPGNLGSMIRSIKYGYYFNIGNGNVKKSMVLGSDVAKFIFKSSEVGGIYNLTDGNHPSFNEISSKISFELNKRRPISMPYFIAYIIALTLSLFGNLSPFNLIILNKIRKNLTFSDNLARNKFNWLPQNALINNLIK